MQDITDYISDTLLNPTAAENLKNAVLKAIIERFSAPEAYQPAFTKKFHKFTYYRINVKNFSIFYVVKGNVMEVRRILYARRNLDEFL